MLRKVMRGLVVAVCATVCVCAGSDVSAALRKEIVSSKTELPEAKKFNVISEPFEWGLEVTRLLINDGKNRKAAEIKAEDFTVNARHYSEQAVCDDYKGTRKVLDAYPVDEEGNRVEESKYIVLELEYYKDFVEYLDENGDKKYNNITLGSSKYANYYTPLTPYYELEWNDTKYTQDQTSRLVVDEFELARHTESSIADTQYNFVDYALYSPKEDGTKKPLIIFFHGMGEGGASKLNNKGVQLYAYQEEAFAEKEIQDIMGGSAYVLCPQSPEQWPTNGFDKESKYLEVVKSLVDSVIAENSDIDTNRVYIGGLSMGGFMACRMMINYPDMFAAAFPCSQAYSITEADAEKLKELPVWVSCSEQDGLCNMATYTYASYLKLVAAGNRNARCAVVKSNRDDTTCRMEFFTPESKEGTMYEIESEPGKENTKKADLTYNNETYGGHEAGWILVFNNREYYVDNNGKKVTIMEWVASQSLVNKLVLDTTKVKKEYKPGQAFSADGLAVTAEMRNGEKVNVTDYSVKAVDTSKVGTYSVEVSYSGKTATYTISVADSAVSSTPTPTPAPTQAQCDTTIKLSTSSLVLFKKGLNKATVKATVTNSSSSVEWSSSNEKVATVRNGVIVAKKAGTAVIKATVNGVVATCKVTVKNGTFKIKKKSLAVKVGKTVKIGVTVSPKKPVKFKASSKIIKVNSKGSVRGVKKGTAKVTITFMGVKQTVTIKVK